MKKKILIVLLTFALFVLCICKSIPVDAKSNVWTSTGTPAIDSNNQVITDTIDDGCFISIVDFLDTPQNFIRFINLHEGKDYPVYDNTILDSTYFVQCMFDYSGKYTYFNSSEDFGSYFIFFHSKSKLNNWLVNNRFIDPGKTFEDPIYGFTGPEINKVERNSYICLDDILNSNELVFDIVNPKSLPSGFYKENEKIFEVLGNWYTIYNTMDYSVIDGIWNYKEPSLTENGGEVSKIDMPNSIGKFEKISNTTYQYNYTILDWDQEFGYYSHNQAEVKTITLQKSEMPSIAFDSNGYLKDDYFSVNVNKWYKAYVKDVTKEIHFDCYLNRVQLVEEWDRSSIDELVGAGKGAYCYFEMYFEFDLPIDCIYQLSYNLPLYYKLPFKTYHVSDFHCSLNFDQKASINQLVDYDNLFEFFLHPFNVTEFVSKPVIEKGNFSFDVDGKTNNFSWKTIFVDDEFSAYNANVSYLFNGEKIVRWKDTPEKFLNSPTYFNANYFCSQNDARIKASAIYSYKGILYSFEGVDGNLVNSKDTDDDMFSKFLMWLKELLNKLMMWFNNSTFGKMLKWTLIICIALLTIYGIYKVVNAIKMSKFLKNKKSTK